VRDLHEWLCRRPPNARHVGTTSSDDGGATFAEFYAEYPQHAAKRKCKGSGIKSVVEAHGKPLLEWIDSGSCGMGRVRVSASFSAAAATIGGDSLALVGGCGAKSSSSSSSSMAVVVSGLPWKATETEIVSFFEARRARVESCSSLPACHGRSSGRARLVLADARARQAALLLDGEFFNDSGRWLQVQPEPLLEPNSAPPVLESRATPLFGQETTPPSSPGGAMPMMMQMPPSKHLPKFTTLTVTTHNYSRLCKFAARGLQCPFGPGCRYAHTQAQLSGALSSSSSSATTTRHLLRPLYGGGGSGRGGEPPPPAVSTCQSSTSSSAASSPVKPVVVKAAATSPQFHHHHHHHHHPRGGGSSSSIGPTQSVDVVDVAAVVEEIGLEKDRWVPHFLRHELDRDALSLCEDSDLEQLGLPLGARVKHRRWKESYNLTTRQVVTPPTPPETRFYFHQVADTHKHLSVNTQ